MNMEYTIKKMLNSEAEFNYWVYSTPMVMALLAMAFLQMYSEFFNNVLKYPVILIGIILCALIAKEVAIDIKGICIIGLTVVAMGVHLLVVQDLALFITIKIFVVFLPIALYFLFSDQLPLWGWTVFIAFLWIFVLACWYNTPDDYLLFYETSRNYVSIYSLLFCFLLAIVWNKNGYSFPFVFCVICFCACVWAIGRSGILAALLLLVIFGLKKAKNTKYRLLIVSGCSILVLMLIMFTSIQDYIEIGNRFFSRFMDFKALGSNNERLYIYSSYVQTAIDNPKNLLLGVDTDHVNGIISSKNGNLHNSFLQFHAYFGAIMLVLFIYAIIRSCVCLHRSKEIDVLIIYIVFLFRCLFDYCFPGTVGDVVIWYCILSPFVMRQRRREQSKQLA